MVSPIGFESDIETPQAAEQTATDYTGISIDIPLIGKENVSGGFEIGNKELINFSLSKTATPIETEKLLSAVRGGGNFLFSGISSIWCHRVS